jgi:hypothetical protein
MSKQVESEQVGVKPGELMQMEVEDYIKADSEDKMSEKRGSPEPAGHGLVEGLGGTNEKLWARFLKAMKEIGCTPSATMPWQRVLEKDLPAGTFKEFEIHELLSHILTSKGLMPTKEVAMGSEAAAGVARRPRIRKRGRHTASSLPHQRVMGERPSVTTIGGVELNTEYCDTRGDGLYPKQKDSTRYKVANRIVSVITLRWQETAPGVKVYLALNSACVCTCMWVAVYM